MGNDADADRLLSAAGVHLYELEGENERLRAQNEQLRALLARYRDETPLGHQPHMIAQEVDEALGR